MGINVASALDLSSHPAFGAYPPTPLQKSILQWFHSTPLGFTRFRRKAVRPFASLLLNAPTCSTCSREQ